jgi:hypothetical protein
MGLKQPPHKPFLTIIIFSLIYYTATIASDEFSLHFAHILTTGNFDDAHALQSPYPFYLELALSARRWLGIARQLERVKHPLSRETSDDFRHGSNKKRCNLLMATSE